LQNIIPSAVMNKELKGLHFATRRTLLFKVSAFALIVVLFSTAAYWIRAASHEQAYTSELSETMDYMRDTLALPLWNMDRDSLQRQGNIILRNSLVAGGAILDDESSVIWSAKSAEPDSETVLLSVPISYEDEEIGELRLQFSRRSLNQALETDLTIIIGIAIFLILLAYWVWRLRTEVDLRRSAEVSIQKERDTAQSYLSVASVLMVAVNRDQKVALANRMACEILGCSEQEIVGKNWFDKFIPKQQVGSVKRVFDQTISGDVPPVEFFESAVLTSDGNERLIAWHNVLLRDEKGEISSILSSGEDVTERRKSEALVLKLSQAIEQTGESIVITDMDGIIEYINPAFSKTTGYSFDEAVGQSPSILKSGEQDEAYYQDMWTTVKAGNIWRGKLIDRKKDGTLYPVMMTISPIRNEVDVITHLVGIQQDVSEQEKLENQFLQAQKMESLGTLVGGIAHDFNNSLGGITGNLYLAKQAASELPEVVKRLDIIEKLSFRSAEQIKSLLSFARKGIIQKSNIPLISFLKELIKLHQAALPESIELKYDLKTVAMSVKGDASLIQQALINVINNARDAILEVEEPSISIKLREFSADNKFLEAHPECASGSYACISISDNGCGIEPDEIKHIFEPFYTTKGIGQGTGLGLSMVFGALQSHGGAVEVESSAGEGTIVRIYIPVVEVEGPSTESEEEIVKGHGETILLVDDNSGVLDTGKEVLKGLNYNVLTASDGEEAIRLFNANRDRIDLILIDVVMPVMGGVEAVKYLRKTNPELKAVFATGYDRDHMRNSDNLDSEPIISKPYRIHDLSHILRKELDESGVKT